MNMSHEKPHVGKIMRETQNDFTGEIQKNSGSLCNHRQTILLRSVRKLFDRPWTAPFAGATGVATLTSGCVMLCKCTVGNHGAVGCDTGQVMNLKLSETHFVPLLQLCYAVSYRAPEGRIILRLKNCGTRAFLSNLHPAVVLFTPTLHACEIINDWL
jgi:hypothetical protein